MAGSFKETWFNGKDATTVRNELDSGGGGGGAVSSVFARTGAVVAVAGDYAAAQIAFTPASGVAAVEVQAAIVEVAGDASAAAAAASAAQGTANTAVSNAATAQGTANTALSNAATAQATANAAIPLTQKDAASGVVGLDASSNAVVVGDVTGARLRTASLGTSLLPSITPSGDPDCGRWYPAANTIVDMVGNNVEGWRQAPTFVSTTQPANARQPVANVTAAAIALQISSGAGQCYTNTGTTAKNVITVPPSGASPVGSVYEACVTDTDGIQFKMNSGQAIRDGAAVGASAGYIESTTIGDTIRLLAITNTEWVVMWKRGTWTLT